jgi:hypothetical protein
MGARFAGPCAANSLQNTYDGTYGDLLCRNLSAECHTVAWSGIGVLCYYGPGCDPEVEAPHNMPNTVRFTLGGTRDSVDAADLWDFSSFVPDGILVNLGTNDWSGGRAANATFIGEWVAAYTAFVHALTAGDYSAPSLPVFLAMGPRSLAPSAAVGQVVAAVNAAGGNATFIELATPGAPIGCAGHPSPAMHAAMAAIAAPVIAATLGW